MIIVKARELAERPRNLHTTVSELHVTPNSPVTIAREARLHVDLRSEDQATVEQSVKEL